MKKQTKVILLLAAVTLSSNAIADWYSTPRFGGGTNYSDGSYSTPRFGGGTSYSDGSYSTPRFGGGTNYYGD